MLSRNPSPEQKSDKQREKAQEEDSETHDPRNLGLTRSRRQNGVIKDAIWEPNPADVRRSGFHAGGLLPKMLRLVLISNKPKSF